MMTVAKALASVLGIGLMRKGAGTVAALFLCLAWKVSGAAIVDGKTGSLLCFGLLALGVWSATKVERHWGHDSNRVVIDEVLGMQLALLQCPVQWWPLATAFVLFRFFDIAKPLGIRRAEKFRSGWGVMLDDVLAGLYALAVMQVLFWTKVF